MIIRKTCVNDLYYFSNRSNVFSCFWNTDCNLWRSHSQITLVRAINQLIQLWAEKFLKIFI